MLHADPITVLVVEDEMLIRMDLADTLLDRGLIVIEAASADEAKSMLDDGLHIDMLITDVDMPGKLNGIDLAVLVSATRPGVYIIVTSGREDAAVMIPPGAAFMPKPYSPVFLSETASPCAASAA